MPRLWTRFCAMPHVVHILLAIALICIVVPAFADSIARQGSDWVRLSLHPCAGKAAEAVKRLQGDPLAFRAGSAHIAGQDYSLCWQPAGGGAALVFDDGDTGAVPIADLKPAPEA